MCIISVDRNKTAGKNDKKQMFSSKVIVIDGTVMERALYLFRDKYIHQVHSIMNATRVHMYTRVYTCVVQKYCAYLQITRIRWIKKKILVEGRSNVFWPLRIEFNCVGGKIVPLTLPVPDIIQYRYAKARRSNTITIDARTRMVQYIYTKTSKHTMKPYELRRRK